MAHDVFISYSNKNKTVANAVCGTLEGRKIRCWIAPRDLEAGKPYSASLVNAISESRVLVLVLSEGSNKSDHVLSEVDEAMNNGIPILSLRIEDVDPSKELRYYIKKYHWLDAMTPPMEQHLEKLADSVQALLSVGEVQPETIVEPRLEQPVSKTRSFPKWAIAAIILVGILLLTSLGIWAFSQSSFLSRQDTVEDTAIEAGVVDVTPLSINKSVNVLVGGGEGSAQEYEEATDTVEDTAIEAGVVDVTPLSINKSVNVLVGGGEGSAQEYEEATDPFEQQTGINIIYEGSDDFENEIVQRVQAGNPPDVAFIPQPGLLGNLVTDTIDLNDWFSSTYFLEQYDQTWLDMSEINGHMAGVWYRTTTKSLVWYPKAEFEAANYAVPTTWNEMIALSEQMISDGRTPWCLGIASGPATGWVGTDWVEDIMLRTTSPENYDKWVNGEMKFSSTEVISAWQTMGEIWFADDYVLGGRQAITTTFFLNAMDPIYENPPGCWLHRQSMFIANSIPESAEFGIDVDYFYLPPIDSQYGDPVLVAGDIAAVFNDTAVIRDYVSYLTTSESVKYFIELGTYLSPHKDSKLEWYPDSLIGAAEILSNADTVQFDGSDLMPGIVGAGTFWEGIVDYVNGKDLNSILEDIDSSWP